MSSFVPSEITEPFFELQTPDFAWKFVWTVWTNFDKILKKMKKKLRKWRNAITQPFFELQTPDFAWKLVWTVWTDYDKILKKMKKMKKKCKKHKKKKCTKKWTSSLDAAIRSSILLVYPQLIIQSKLLFVRCSRFGQIVSMSWGHGVMR